LVVFLFYIERIDVWFFAGIAGYVKKKKDGKTPIKNKKTAESLNMKH